MSENKEIFHKGLNNFMEDYRFKPQSFPKIEKSEV